MACGRDVESFDGRRRVSQSALCLEQEHSSHLQLIPEFIERIAVQFAPIWAARVSQVSPDLVVSKDSQHICITRDIDISRLTERYMFLYMQQHKIAFSDDQE